MPEKTTTHFGWGYPTSAGEVKLGATDIEELATAADTTMYEGNKVANGQTYSGFASKTRAAVHAGFEPSATRASFLAIKLKSAEATWGAKVEVAAKGAGYTLLQKETGTTIPVLVPAGATVKIDKDEPAGTELAAGVTVEISTLLL